jgi:hypothetical protein
MAWQVPAQESTYTVTAFDHERPVWRGEATSDENGELRFAIAADGVRPLMVLVRPRFGPEGDLLAGALPERLASREMLADAGPEPAAGHDLVVCLAPDDERSRPADGVGAPGELSSPAKPSCTVLPHVGSDG